jgi:hypothetical protein
MDSCYGFNCIVRVPGYSYLSIRGKRIIIIIVDADDLVALVSPRVLVRLGGQSIHALGLGIISPCKPTAMPNGTYRTRFE